MKIKNVSIKKFLGALLLTVLEVQLFNLLEWIKFLTAFIPEIFITLIVNSLDVFVILSLNLWILNLLTKGFKKLVNKSDFLSKVISWFRRNKSLTFILLCVLSAFITSFFISQIHFNYKSKDYSVPTITVTPAEKTTVMANQYEKPLVYYLCFDDETEVQKVLFDESFVVVENCDANITIVKSDDCHYVLSLNNIDGQTGQYQVLIKEGAVIDTSGNKSEEIKLSEFYLYNDESEVDKTPPQLVLTQVDTNDSSCLVFDLKCTDDRELSSMYIQPDDIIPIGFNADIKIETSEDGINRRIILNNLVYHEKTDNCKLVISAGVATDMWDNKSPSYIYNNLIFK